MSKRKIFHCWNREEVNTLYNQKTFATTVLLYNDVPMEVVSELLGHSKMATTQMSYGKIIQKKLGEEMRRLNKKLGS